MKTITEIDGDNAIIRVIPPSKHERLAALLLEAAGEERKREVRSISTGGRGFRVPLDIVAAAGLIQNGQDDTESPGFDAGGVIASGATVVNDTGSPIDVQTVETVDRAADQIVPAPADADTPAQEPQPSDTAPAPENTPADPEAKESTPARKTTSRAKTKPADKASDDKAGDQG
ncbi:hypothetical protein [Nocardia africana]